MKALDLFCCAGAASDGLTRAGFEVTGVDIKRRKNYPYRFIEADAVTLDIDLSEFDFIWASPPCQRYSLSTRGRKNYRAENYPDLIDPIRRKIAGHPFTCIENVPVAPLRADLVLTGPSVGLHRIERRRIFELSFMVWGGATRAAIASLDMGKRSGDHDNHVPELQKPFLPPQTCRITWSCVAARSLRGYGHRSVVDRGRGRGSHPSRLCRADCQGGDLRRLRPAQGGG